MEHISVRRLAIALCSLLFLLGAFSACQRKTETAAAPSPAASPGLSPALSPAGSPGPSATASAPTTTPKVVATPPPIVGPVTPALVTQNDVDSITHYLHFPKDPEVAKLDGSVQFYCDVNEAGLVESTHALVANNEAFKEAVQTALDWGKFTPATVNGQAVRAYVGGSVFFLHRGHEELIVVSLATYDRARVSKLENYIQPQLIGGLSPALAKAINSLIQGGLVPGRAELVANVDAKGVLTGTSAISENPKGSGLGALLDGAVKQSQFTPAYENGKPAAGGVNIVADFSQYY